MDDRNVESIVSLVDASDDDDVDEENVAEEKVGSGNKKMKLVHKQTDKVFQQMHLLTLLTKEIGVCQSLQIRVFCYC